MADHTFDHVCLGDGDNSELRFEHCKFATKDIVQVSISDDCCDDEWIPPENYPNKAAMEIFSSIFNNPQLTELHVVDFISILSKVEQQITDQC